MRPAMLRGTGVLVALLLGTGAITASAAADTTDLTIRASRVEVLPAKAFSLFGSLSPKQVGITVSRQVQRKGTWHITGSAITNRKGDWKMVVKATAKPELLKLRVVARIKGKLVASDVVRIAVVKRLKPKPSPTPTPTPTPAPTPTDTATASTDTSTAVDTGTVVETPTVVAALGAGKRILGADISRYQHASSLLFPGGAPIDFQQMYRAGARFVIIKASDGRDTGHTNAAKWYAQDRLEAQRAGLYTGFYHYAYFPASNDPVVIQADATAQADKAVWRLAAVGGYTKFDLPFALDLEEWCVSSNADGSCAKSATQANASLWTKTWLARVAARTGRNPIVYGSPSFIAKFLTRDPVFRGYPLWLAHYGPNPKVAANFPSMKSDGTCYINSWTLSPCIPQWSFWQYTSSGKAENFGIAGGNLDLNLFSGTSMEFLSLTQGDWLPATADFLPFNETTTATISDLHFGLLGKPLTLTVDVNRIVGGPVVSGTVSFTLLANTFGIAPTPAQINAIRQSVKRTATGTWFVSVSGLPAGTWIGQISFRDASGVHAASVAPIVFSLIDPNPPVIPPTDTTTVITDTATAIP